MAASVRGIKIRFAFFAVCLIFCSIGLGLASLYPYYQRMNKVLQDETREQVKKENLYRILYTIFGSIIIFIQVCIALFIIRGVIKYKK